MDDEALTVEQRAARDEVHDLLGPWEDDEDVGPVADQVFLDGWVLMASWTDADGQAFLTRIPSRRLQAYQRVGLLHEGLYGFDD